MEMQVRYWEEEFLPARVAEHWGRVHEKESGGEL